MFKKIQKKGGTARIRDDEASNAEEASRESSMRSSNQASLTMAAEVEESKFENSNADVEMPESEYGVKQEIKSRDKSKQRKRGLVHQGSYQYSSMSYTQSSNNDQEQFEFPSQKSLFADKKLDDIMTLTHKISDAQQSSDQIINQDFEDEDIQLTDEQRIQVTRIKELRNQKRKLDGNDYIPFDESTSGGVFAKDQINAVNNTIQNFEAHALQKQLIKDRYSIKPSIQQASSIKRGIIDQDQIMHEEMGVEMDDEDQEEVEAFIKKRVKQGSGRDYEAIVQKDIVNYQKVSGNIMNDFSDINKFENSKTYKQTQMLMEINYESCLNEIEKEIQENIDSIARNEKKQVELKNQELSSQQLINEANQKFEAIGHQFVLAKEASDTLENLKDMLIEKVELIDDLLFRKLQLEKDIKSIIDMTLISHIEDIFKENGESQSSYAFTQNYNQEIDKIIMDARFQNERKIFRKVNQQLEDQNMLWSNILANTRTQEIKQMKAIQEEAQNSIFVDVDETFLSLKDSLFNPIKSLSSIEDLSLKLNDIVELIIPYLQIEQISEDLLDQEYGIFNPENSKVLKEVNEFLFESPEYTEYEKKIFISTLITASLHKQYLSHISNIWNPFDPQETSSLSKSLRVYIDTIVVEQPISSEQTSFGIKYVKEILNQVLNRMNQTLDFFNLTSITCTVLPLLNALDSLCESTLTFKSLLPSINLDNLLFDNLLLSNFLKSLGKRLHKIASDSQLEKSDQIAIDLERAQLAYELIYESVRQYLEERGNEESAQKVYKVIEEMRREKGLK